MPTGSAEDHHRNDRRAAARIRSIVPHVLDADIDVRCHIYDVALQSGVLPTLTGDFWRL